MEQPTNPTPAQPAVPAWRLEAREQIIQGLRELADWLRAHPDIVVTSAYAQVCHIAGTWDDQRASVERDAAQMGVSVTSEADRCRADHTFGGRRGVTLTSFAINDKPEPAGDQDPTPTTPAMTDAELDELADATHDEWLEDRAAEASMPSAVTRHPDGSVTITGDHDVLNFTADKAMELAVLLVAATGYTPPVTPAAEPDPADTHEHLVLADALGRLDAQLGVTVIRTCQDALASTSPALAVAALDALTEAGDEWYADGKGAFQEISADVNTVSVALRRAAGWASA